MLKISNTRTIQQGKVLNPYNSKSIITMTYYKEVKTEKVPSRVKAVANIPKDGPPRSLILSPNDYITYNTVEEIHALAAWQLATQLGWVGANEGDLIPTKLYRLGTTGTGEDIVIWVLASNITAKEFLTISRKLSVSAPTHEYSADRDD